MLMKCTYTELRNAKQGLFISEILDGYTQLFISFVNVYIFTFFCIFFVVVVLKLILRIVQIDANFTVLTSLTCGKKS